MMSFTITQPSRRAVLIAFAFLICVWLPMLATGLAQSVCLNAKYDPEKRLRYCNFSLALSPFTVLSYEDRKMSRPYMTRGILLADAGDAVGAKRDMRKALDLATDGQAYEALAKVGDPQTFSGPAPANHTERFPITLLWEGDSDPSEEAKQLWSEVIRDVQEQP